MTGVAERILALWQRLSPQPPHPSPPPVEAPPAPVPEAHLGPGFQVLEIDGEYRFSPSDVGQHIAHFHPGCPKTIRKKLIQRLISRGWAEPKMGIAVGITIENFLRHEVTGYDRLLQLGVERPALRAMIRPEIDAVLAVWARPQIKQDCEETATV